MITLANLLEAYLTGRYCEISLTIMDEEGNYSYDWIKGIDDDFIINCTPQEFIKREMDRKSELIKYQDLVVKMFWINKGVLEVTVLRGIC